MTDTNKDEDKLTEVEIFLLRDMLQWWKRARMLQFENLINDEKDSTTRDKLLKAVDILRSMK